MAYLLKKNWCDRSATALRFTARGIQDAHSSRRIFFDHSATGKDVFWNCQRRRYQQPFTVREGETMLTCPRTGCGKFMPAGDFLMPGDTALIRDFARSADA